MQNLFSKVEIKHFKSIIDTTLQPKRINLIIGKPNSGKSNILEALSLFGPYYNTTRVENNQRRFFNKIIRYNEMNQLFYDMDIHKPVEVITDKCQARIRHLKGLDYYDFIVTENKKELKITEYTGVQYMGTTMNKLREFEQTKPTAKFINTYYNYISLTGIENQQNIVNDGLSPVKKYFFHEKEFFTSSFSEFLLPSGDNLYQIIQSSKKLREIIDSILEESNLELVFINKSKTFEIQKRVNRIAYQTPYLLTADTLQRLIYHLAAVISNKDSVLLFEEPEAHSFPPYINILTQQIINSAKNQFFITTHSPYIVNQFLDQVKPTDLAIFIAYYKEHNTKIKKLTANEMKQIHGYGIDIFYNLNDFIKND